jgi:glutathione reductase (NADPH)
MYSDAGISVNEHLRSRTNPRVYAGGDAADGGGLPLTPVAIAEGDLIARNLLDGDRYAMDFAGLVSIAYTVPALGKSGLTESQARSQGLRFTVREGDTTAWASSRRLRVPRSAYRILVEDQTDHVLGAHFLGAHTEELVNVFSLAIRERIPASRLGNVLFAYPTGSSDIEYMIK